MVTKEDFNKFLKSIDDFHKKRCYSHTFSDYLNYLCGKEKINRYGVEEYLSKNPDALLSDYVKFASTRNENVITYREATSIMYDFGINNSDKTSDFTRKYTEEILDIYDNIELYGNKPVNEIHKYYKKLVDIYNVGGDYVLNVLRKNNLPLSTEIVSIEKVNKKEFTFTGYYCNKETETFYQNLIKFDNGTTVIEESPFLFKMKLENKIEDSANLVEIYTEDCYGGWWDVYRWDNGKCVYEYGGRD